MAASCTPASPPAEELAENLQRQLDEIEAIEAILTTTCHLSTGADLLTRYRDEGADVVATAATADRPPLDVTVPVPVGESSTARLRVVMPLGYPSLEVPEVTCGFDELKSKASRAALTADLAQFVTSAAEAAAGGELLLELTQRLSETAERLLQQQSEEQEQADKAKGAASSRGPSEWRRFYFWVDHLLKGKEHKKEAEVESIIKGSGLSGKIYYGRPGLVALEGPEAHVDDCVRDCGKAGKALKVRKSQPMGAGPADRFFPAKAATEGATKAGGLDVDAVQADLRALGLEHKFKHIIGLEQLQ